MVAVLKRRGLKGDEIRTELLAQPISHVMFIESGWISGYDTISLALADGTMIVLGAGGEDHGIQVERVEFGR